MAHNHNVVVKDTDARFVIDTVSRTIKNKSKKNKLVQYDHNSERFGFEMPRYNDEHDFSTVDRVEIHFINIEQKTKAENRDMYLVEDLTISDDSEKVLFSWLVSSNATQLIGSLDFLIEFLCTDGEEITYSWHTEIHSGLKIAKGMDNTEAVIQDNSDILEAWRNEVLAGIEAAKMPDKTLTEEGIAADAKAVGDALEKKLNADKLPEAINEALAQAKESGEFDGEDYILTETDKEEIKEAVLSEIEIPEIPEQSVTAEGAVLFSEIQSLTEEEQQTARSNIGIEWLESSDSALETLAEMGIVEPVTDENGSIMTDENNNILCI